MYRVVIIEEVWDVVKDVKVFRFNENIEFVFG